MLNWICELPFMLQVAGGVLIALILFKIIPHLFGTDHW